MADADVKVTELEAAAEASSGAADPNSLSTERPPSAREDLLQNAFFDVERGVKLASFAFSIYGTPVIDHWYNGVAGTKIGLTPETLHRSFRASLKCVVLRAKDLPKEQSTVDYLMSGQKPDPYVIVEIKSPFGYAQGKTPAVKDSFTPEWTDQTFDLLVHDPADAVLEVAVKDEHCVGKSFVLGKGTKALVELDAAGAGTWTGWVELQDGKGNAAGSVELSLELAATPAPPALEGDDAEDAYAPKSTDNLDWHDMAARVTDASLSLRKYRMAVFFSNEETDTQGGIWWRPATKEVMIIFRGTEITSVKDVLTDMMITQKPLTAAKGEARLIHSGFHAAFYSVLDSVQHSMEMVIGRGRDLAADGWTVDCSGHSLGGALASLMAHNLAHKYPTLARENRLHMYSFGAPRVGNTQFCEDYNEMLGHAAFRIVNKADVVPRMPPRSNPGTGIVYDHFGFTILLTDEALQNISIYLEGQQQPPTDATNPPPPQEEESALERGIKEGAPISKAVADADAANPRTPTTIEAMLGLAAQTPKEALGGLVKNPKVGAFERAEAGEEVKGLGVSTSTIKGGTRRGSISVSASTVPSVVMEESLLKGTVSDHMETSYFEAIQRAFAQLMKEGVVHGTGMKEEEERA